MCLSPRNLRQDDVKTVYAWADKGQHNEKEVEINMVGLLSLPPELIRLIGDKLEAEQKTLRLICQFFDEIISPRVLSSLEIDFPRKATSTLELFDALITNDQRTKRWSSRARSLTVVAFHPTRNRPWNENQRYQFSYCFANLNLKLGRAVSALTGLERVLWNLGCRDEPEWIHNAFVTGLATLPRLKSLELNISYGRPSWNINLGRIPTLTTLKFTVDQRLRYHCFSENGAAEKLLISQAISSAPNVQSLGVIIAGNCPGIPEGFISLNDLLEPQTNASPSFVKLTLTGVTPKLAPSNSNRLRFLKSLSLECSLSPSQDFDSLWALLRKEQVHLKEIITDRVTANLIDYLAHYSGLKRLDLIPRSHRSSPPLHKGTVTAFLHQILPRHHQSLQHLSLMAIHRSDWCISPDIIRMLHCCTELRYLGFLVDMKVEVDSNDLDFFIGAIITTVSIEIKNLTTLSIDTICDHPSKDDHISSFSTLMLSLHAKEYIQSYILKYRSAPPVNRLPDIRQGHKLFSGVKCSNDAREGYTMRYIVSVRPHNFGRILSF